MLRRGIVFALIALSAAVTAHTAAADPTNAKKNQVMVATCDGEQLVFSANTTGQYPPGHDTSSTRVFIPTSFNLTFVLTSPDGSTLVQHDTHAHMQQPSDPVVCVLSDTANTVLFPDGTTMTMSGTITGSFAHSS